ncbi:hypothetical protein CSQ79_24535 [Gloeocapsopsis sp. IPPAS B-1203]|nr:hypothetical protein CSQ79_24535 [Gloeocapsopsis sp. IPPAS B-1203]
MMSDLVYLRGTQKELRPVIIAMMATYQLLQGKDVGSIYGYPSEQIQARRRFKPRIFLYFEQRNTLNAANFKPKRGEISFRIMDEEYSTITNGELTRLATNIKTQFGANGGYEWNKGKTMYAYTDWDKGYQFQMLCRSSTQARELVTKVLAIQNHSPEWGKLAKSEAEDETAAYPDIPGQHRVLGEMVDKPQRRPRVEVCFTYAYAEIWGKPNPVILYDPLGKKGNALIT